MPEDATKEPRKLAPVSAKGVVRLLELVAACPWPAGDLRVLASMTSGKHHAPDFTVDQVSARARMPLYQVLYRLEALAKHGWLVKRGDRFCVDLTVEKWVESMCLEACVTRGGIIRTMAAYCSAEDLPVFRLLFVLKVARMAPKQRLVGMLNGISEEALEVSLRRAGSGMGYIEQQGAFFRLSDTGEVFVSAALKHINSPLVLS